MTDHVACPDCGGSDCLALYPQDDGTVNGTCWSACKAEDGRGYKSHNHLARSYLGEELGIEVIKQGKSMSESTNRRKAIKKKKPAKPLTEAEITKIKSDTSTEGDDFRGIDDYWLEYYGVRTAYNEETGEVSDRYYPVTKGALTDDIKLVGYHRRIVEGKKFLAVGLNSKDCDLFGQFRCVNSKRLVITGGQEDCMAATQMFEEYRDSKGHDSIAPIDFCSGTVGETSVASQLQDKYDFLSLIHISEPTRPY